MSATQHCPICSGSTFRLIEGSNNQYVICECTIADLEDTPHQRGFQEGFLAGYKSGCEDGKAFARRQIEEADLPADTGATLAAPVT